MGSFSIWHWLIVLAVIILVFGTKKLRNLGSDLGSAVKGFKQGVKEDEPDSSTHQHAVIDNQPADPAQPASEKQHKEHV